MNSPKYYSNEYNSPKQNFQKQQSCIEELGPYTILCGRSSAAYNHIGNRRFRMTINLNLQRYMEARSKKSKGEVIRSTLKFLCEDVGAQFVKEQNSSYVEITKKAAYEKVSHSLRDLALNATRQHKSKATINSRNKKSLNILDAPISHAEAASLPFPDFNPFDEDETFGFETTINSTKTESHLSKETFHPDQIFSEVVLSSDEMVSRSSFASVASSDSDLSETSSSESNLSDEEEAEYKELNLDDMDSNNNCYNNNLEWEDEMAHALHFEEFAGICI